jgi:DHA1 family bicyclomycin/chloramphenicol resistance-like MFS transporter
MNSTTSDSKRGLILWTLFAATCLALLQVSIYVPSMPGIARYFSVPISAIQLTVTIYAIGFAIGNLFWGPISDRYGRRPALVIGSVLCLIASAVCLFAPSIEVLFVGRVIQAFGASSIMVAGRAVVRDIFDRLGTARALSLLATSANIMPVAAPVLGGYLEVWFDWRASFVVILAFAALITGIVWKVLPETNVTAQTSGSLMASMVGGYGQLLRKVRFVGYALTNMSGGMCFFAFLAAAPAILINAGGLSPHHFGFFASMMPIGFMLSTYLNSRVVTRQGIDRMLFVGGIFNLLSGTLLMALAPIGANWVMIPCCFLAGFGNGFVMPNGNAGAVSVIPPLAGAASGFSAFCQMIIASLVTAALSATTITSAMPLGISFAASGFVVFLGLALCRLGRRPA